MNYDIYDGYIFFHDKDCTNNCAGDDSYRYAGPNPNNWVCFGYDINNYNNECENGTFSATSDYAYRIIGFFRDVDGSNDNRYYIKLIKATPYVGKDATNGKYYWSGSSNNKVNTFASSTLFSDTLNGDSESYLALLTTNDWYSYLAQPIWNVGKCSQSNCQYAVAKTAYTEEMTGQGVTITNNSYKIGLMYVNDYGYAAGDSSWTTTLDSYNSVATSNWLFLGSDEWTITSYTNWLDTSFWVTDTGYTAGTYVYKSAGAIRPVMYLKSNIEITLGNGTISSPYHLKIGE